MSTYTQKALDKVAHLGKHENDEGASTEESPSAQERLAAWLSGFATGEVISNEDAAMLLPDLADKIHFYGESANKFFTISNRDLAPCTIWEFDAGEAKTLAKAWLKRAQVDERAAATVRFALEGDDYIWSLVILGPRMLETARWYPQHHWRSVHLKKE